MQGADLHVATLAVLFAFSLGLGIWSLFSINAEAVATTTRPDEFFTESPLFKVLLPYIQILGRRLETMKALEKTRTGLGKKLLAAGKRDTITPDEFLATIILGSALT